jgi:predicted acetyltransferase
LKIHAFTGILVPYLSNVEGLNMSLEIRQINEEEMDAFNRNVHIAFASSDDMYNMSIRTEWTLCAFEDGRLATSYMAWPLTMYFDGARFPVAGVSMVGTLPIHRRKGHLRKLTQRHFEMLYESRQQPITALNASMAAIYQRFGYGIVSSKNTYNFEPRHLQFSAGCVIPGSFYEAGDNDMATILEIYDKFAVPRVGCLQRDEKLEVAPGAPLTVLAIPPSPVPPMKLIYQEGEKPLSYVIYSVTRGLKPGDQQLNIHDLAWVTPQAYRAIWECFANMDLVRNITWGRVPTDDPLPHILLEPRKLGSVNGDGLLARFVDVARAIPMRPYREEASLTFELIDDFCSWNAGKWKLEVSPTGADMKPTDESPQLTMPVSTLAMLMFGQISATEASRMARLDVHEDGSLNAWDRVMRTPYRPFCADMF